MTGPVFDLAGVEDVNLRDDLLVNLPLLELRILRLIHRRRLLPGRFEIEPLQKIGQIRPDRVALRKRETGKPDVIGVQLTRLLKAEQGRIDQRAAGIEDDNLLPGSHCNCREIRGGNRHAREENGKDHPEPGGDQVVSDGGDGGEFHTGLSFGSSGGPCRAFEECALKAAWAA
jgi:hypothetical protein